MELIVGQGFDHRAPHPTPPRLGSEAVGQEGLLQRLEFRAGLTPPRQSHAERVVGYLQALRAADGPARFYHASLAADPVATASHLLAWRDYALDHGWSPQSGPDTPGRLADLAAVEDRLPTLAPGLAARVERLLPRLSLVAAAIHRLTLVDEPADWAPPLRRLFAALPAAGIPVAITPTTAAPGAPADTDLGRLQRALLDPARPGDPLTLRGDGSLGLYHCQEALGATLALSDLLARQPDHLLISGTDAFILGTAARARGWPHAGLGDSSAWRPPLQLLPLLLQLAWSPPPAEILLQYLTLPAGPLGRLRRRLARLFVDRPGYDPDTWQECIDDQVADDLAADPTRKEADRRDRIAAWLPLGRAGSGERMPLTLAIQLADQVRQYWHARLSLAEGEARELAAAGQAAEALAAALRAWGEAEIGRESLHRLLELSALAGATAMHPVRQVASLNLVDDPAAARLAPAGPAHLVWWDPALGPAPATPPFTAAERALLPAAPDAAARQAQTQARLRRALYPLLQARHGALLVVRGTAGDLLRMHLDRLLPAGYWRSFEADLLAGTLAGLPTAPVADLSLPPARRWWQADRALPAPRERESYTSLSALALTPHDYVLRYLARLSQGAIQDLPVDARLLGNLAHRLIQDWFAARPWQGSAPEEAAVATWLEERLPAAIEANALPLAAPGRRADRLAFATRLTTALTRLLEHLASAGVEEVRSESTLAAVQDGLTLEGTLDLLGRRADGHWVIVDLKWGGEAQRIAELREGRYLQLAVYDRLADDLSPGGVADLAYFILQSATLLATSQRCFPHARVVAPDDPALTPALVWQRLRGTLAWRQAQLAAGQVEVTTNGAEPTEASIPPAGALPASEMSPPAQAPRWSRGGKPRFKPIDPWRVLTGNLQP